MARYYMASDLIERCYEKWGIELNEKDVEEIVKNIAPKEQDNELYTEKAFDEFKRYYDEYKRACDELTRAIDKSTTEPLIEDRIRKLNQRADAIERNLDKLQIDSPDNDLYKGLEKDLDRAKQVIDDAKELQHELKEKEYASPYEQYSKIKQANSNLDEAEKCFNVLEKSLNINIEPHEKEETNSQEEEQTQERTGRKVYGRADVIGKGGEINEIDTADKANEFDENERATEKRTHKRSDIHESDESVDEQHNEENRNTVPVPPDEERYDEDDRERERERERNVADEYHPPQEKAKFNREEIKSDRINSGERHSRTDDRLNVLKNREVQTAARSIARTYQDVAELNRTEVAQGYNKVRPLTDTATSLGMIAVGHAANSRAKQELEKLDFDEINKILRNNKIIGRDANIVVKSENERNLYLSTIKEYCKKQNLQNFGTMPEKDLRAFINSGKLTEEQKRIAESILKVNKLGAGDAYIHRGGNTIKRTAKKVGDRVSDDNDIVTGASMIMDVTRNARLAYKRFAKVSKYLRLTGQRGANVTTRLTKATVQKARNLKESINNRRNRPRINTRTTDLKKGVDVAKSAKAAKAADAAAHAGAALGQSATVSTGISGAVGGGFGTFVGRKLTGFAGNMKRFILNPKQTFRQLAKLLSKVASKVVSSSILYLVLICIAIGLVCTCVGCIVSFFTAMFAYTNDAFSTSDSLIENVSTFIGHLDLVVDDGNGETSERDDADGLECAVEDSVGYKALQNVATFYTKYDKVAHDGLKSKVENYGSGIFAELFNNQKCQDISNIYSASSSVLPKEIAETYLYNDMEGNDSLSRYFSESRGKKSIDPITYYISSNTIDQVMDGTVGSDYPYWNASEVLAMSSVKYSNSINPYNYRRYNRSLRYQAYSCDVKLLQQAKNWFKDVFGMKESSRDNDNIKIDSNQVYLSDPELVNKVDENYTGQENIYVGFTKLTTSDMNFITSGHHGGSGENGRFLCEYTETHGGEYDEGTMNEVLNNAADYLKEQQQNGTAMCDHTITGISHNTDSYTSTDANGNEHEVVNTSYTVKFYCKGHYLAQAYIRCATLSGAQSLYQIDDDNGGNKGWLESIVDKIFPNEYDKWGEADGEEPNIAAVEAKEEVAEMLSENWEETYGFTWSEIFPSTEDYKTYGTQLSQGDGRLEDEDGNKTALGVARDYVESKLEEMRKDYENYTDEDIRRIEIIDTATSYAGRIKYYYGANDVENGISDCSAFISDSLGIGRTTTADIMGWNQIGYDELKPGDLLCKDGHVRMYIATVQLASGEYRYLTVENTSGSDATHGIHGCSCAYYSKNDLERSGYVGIDINGHYD